MSLAATLLQASSAMRWLRRLGGPGLLIVGIADASPLPLPGGSTDLLTLVLAARHSEPWGYYALLATLGSVVGGYLAARLAESGGSGLLEKRVGPRRAAEVRESLQRRGWTGIALGALLPPPFPFTLVVMAAGIARVPHTKLLSALAVGRGIRFTLAAWLGYRYGRPMIRLFRRLLPSPLHVAIAVVVAAALVTAAWYFWRLRHRHRAAY